MMTGSQVCVWEPKVAAELARCAATAVSWVPAVHAVLHHNPANQAPVNKGRPDDRQKSSKRNKVARLTTQGPL